MKTLKRKPAVAPINALAVSKIRAISMLDANGDCCPRPSKKDGRWVAPATWQLPGNPQTNRRILNSAKQFKKR
jgi:hypothetical protein